MTEIDIYSAKNSIESMLVGIYGVTGTGISSDSITIYVLTKESESEVRNRIGYDYRGHKLDIIITGELKFL